MIRYEGFRLSDITFRRLLNLWWREFVIHPGYISSPPIFGMKRFDLVNISRTVAMSSTAMAE
jgi:hypothetical protein